MSMPHRTSSSDSDSIRKRVGKACDRCRLKKSKCDGSSPCSRCKADNAICVFGERKRSHDKVYPKGYVEMLEQQQSQLVAGLQETYRRLVAADMWPGAKLEEHNGQPLTHDILAGLDLLEPKQDGSGEMEGFEEDCRSLERRMISAGASYSARRGSLSSESDHEHSHGNRSTTTSSRASVQDTPVTSRAQPIFEDGWSFKASPSPITLSPPPKMVRAQQQSLRPSPLSIESTNQDSYMTSAWQDMTIAPGGGVLHPQFSVNDAVVHDTLQTMMDSFSPQIVSMVDVDCSTIPLDQPYGSQPQNFGPYNPQDWMMSDSVDVDFSKFVQIST
ncbi:hypothetical protein AAFC00_006681 [Neodothiora populina]